MNQPAQSMQVNYTDANAAIVMSVPIGANP